MRRLRVQGYIDPEDPMKMSVSAMPGLNIRPIRAPLAAFTILKRQREERIVSTQLCTLYLSKPICRAEDPDHRPDPCPYQREQQHPLSPLTPLSA